MNSAAFESAVIESWLSKFNVTPKKWAYKVERNEKDSEECWYHELLLEPHLDLHDGKTAWTIFLCVMDQKENSYMYC